MRQTRWSSTAAILALAALALAPPAARPAVAAESDEAQPEPFQRMTPDQVERLLGQGDVHIYDGNSKATYKKGHVPGAVNMYTKDIGPATMPARKDATLIFYCQNTF
jgi:3-mercaptopyruvate sulfurtransferase SseA